MEQFIPYGAWLQTDGLGCIISTLRKIIKQLVRKIREKEKLLGASRTLPDCSKFNHFYLV